jgi:hypothetical protein
MTDIQIANRFNQEGLITNKGYPFTAGGVKFIRFIHKIPALGSQKSEVELSVKQVAERFNVSYNVVYNWIARKLINVRRSGSRPWVSMRSEQELELKKHIERGAL